MRNNLLVTILFLACSTIILSQDLEIKNLQIESKNNGTIIQLESNKKVNLENVTAWYSSEWFYMTIYDANADSLSLINYKNDSLKNIEVSNSGESTQIAVQLFSDIESFEINTPKRKKLQFLLRNNQSISKEQVSYKLINTEKESKERSKFLFKQKMKDKVQNLQIDNNRLLLILGLIIAGFDIGNSTTFLIGALISVLSIFL